MNRSQQAECNTKRSGREFWRQHIETCAQSNLTQAEYCRKNNLSRYAFGYWKTKLNKEKAFRPLLPVSIKPGITPASSSFNNHYPSGVSISYDHRIDVQLEVGFHSDTLLRLIDLLETR